MLVLLSVACGSALRTPERGSHPLDTRSPGVLVDTPPPPARVEEVPKDPGQPCLWMDGSWKWLGRTWEWTPGAWVVPPGSCYYAEPVAVWEAGNLSFTPGTWYHDQTRAVCAPPAPCPLSSSPQPR